MSILLASPTGMPRRYRHMRMLGSSSQQVRQTFVQVDFGACQTAALPFMATLFNQALLNTTGTTLGLRMQCACFICCAEKHPTSLPSQVYGDVAIPQMTVQRPPEAGPSARNYCSGASEGCQSGSLRRRSVSCCSRPPLPASVVMPPWIMRTSSLAPFKHLP